MARPAPPTGTVHVAISGLIFTHKWVNVMWLRLTDDGTQTVDDLNTIIDGMLASYATEFAPHVSGSVTGITADAAWQTGPTTQIATERTHAFSTSGTGIDDASACVVIRWKIGARYRGGKPRTYLPGPGLSDVTNGSDLTTSIQTAFNTAASAFKNAVDALTGVHVSATELGTVSWFTAGGSTTVPPTYRTPPVFEPYTGVGVNPKLGTQRRRIHS